MKKAFTIIELIVVMIILGLMLLMSRNLFTSENQIYFEGEVCANNVHSIVNELHLASLLSRNRSLSGGNMTGLNATSPDWIALFFRFPAVYPGGGSFGTGIDIRGVPNLGSIWSDQSSWSTSRTGVTVDVDNVASLQNFYRGTGEAPLVLTSSTYQYMATQLPVFHNIISGYNNIHVSCINNNYFISLDNDFDATAILLTFQNETTDINVSQKMKLRYTHDINNTSLYRNAYTGAINFNICNRSIQCRQIYRMFFDTRVNSVYQQKCKTYGAN